ncbi:2OG-Fe(II) oxygenase [Alteromonas stellipolaris]|uniref:prolyl hydroxylase family protein n=1 Tax=Alteromonas stellipolaris TaxID=233316 RepID=UPI0021183A71|nr:2OG-Fe(II) oxygenase [Alteromonas stellipolaris]MCQ8847657.1 2OG-Fe(II) oxygenase [Alteromonas stellipolaris]
MQIPELLKEADEAFQNDDVPGAMEFLKDAGLLGERNAALDYAYYAMHASPKLTVEYLNQVPGAKEQVVTYHRLLISYFSKVNTRFREIADSLISLGKDGNVQALLTILAYLPTFHVHFNTVGSWLSKISPNIFSQLNIATFYIDNADSSSETEIAEFLENALSCINHPSEIIETSLPIIEFKGVLSPFECMYLRARFETLLKPSMVVDPVSGQGRYDPIRTSYVAAITADLSDWLIRKIDLMIAYHSNTKPNQGEYLNLLRYAPGQEYKGHFDAISVKQDYAIYQDGAQRIKTALVYLNSVEDGGRTLFPRLDLSVKPVQGNMVIFDNIDAEGRVRPLSFHAGESTISSHKWLLTKWIREEPTSYGKLVHGI